MVPRRAVSYKATAMELLAGSATGCVNPRIWLQSCHENFGPVGDLVCRTKSPGKLGPARPIFLWGEWSGPGTFGLAVALAVAVALALALASSAGPNLPGPFSGDNPKTRYR